MQKRPPKCCYPDCFNCPYIDCRYDRLETKDFSESNSRDYEHFEAWNGKKLHRNAGKEYYSGRQTAAQRTSRKYVDRHEYNQSYYKLYRQEILDKRRAEYDTDKNTKKCRKYVKSHSSERKQYQSDYYQRNAERKLEYARLRYHQKKSQKQVEIDGRV
ncbi:hypothetical protein [Lacrimispora indolis]|uniref:hypothetical protein n=1 Tax=Lacrimispora indolis TaxID=69825 RepID=UPI00045E910B|nr:hypothetical protein [Lacrimispora indolis]